MSKHRKSKTRTLLRLAAFVTGAVALWKEFQAPPEERTWHGYVGGVIPYEYRMPTLARIRERLWDPDGPLIGPQVFGVGWGINLGRLLKVLREPS